MLELQPVPDGTARGLRVRAPALKRRHTLVLHLVSQRGDAAISVDWMVEARAEASSRWNGAGFTSPGPSNHTLGLALAVAAGDAAISVDWMVDARAAASSRWNGAGITSPGPSLKRRHALVLHLPSQQATRPSFDPAISVDRVVEAGAAASS